MANRGLDNKISNIIGTKLPQWLIQQFDVRANRNSDDVRTNENLLYLANKSAWVRLVSSVDIDEKRDQEYFARISNATINTPQSLAKNFVLFGGSSKYKENNSYQLRSGVSYSDPNKTSGGAYGILGKEEIQKYGYRPMPGIMSVNIETQGRLGSVRAAVINFKCWDKQQLDIIDALYFKLGFTMFLEWGHTFYYTSDQPEIVKATEDYAIVDPFRAIKIGDKGSVPNFPSKEEIYSQISETVRETEGNYDAMLGMVTNFNFSYNQEGGYDCTLRLMSLGMLGDSIKINNPSTLPTLLTEEILNLDKTLKLINEQENQSSLPPTEEKPEDSKPGDVLQQIALKQLKVYATSGVTTKTYQELSNTNPDIFSTIALDNNNYFSNLAKKDLRISLGKISSLDQQNNFAFPNSLITGIRKKSNGYLNLDLLSDSDLYRLDYKLENDYVVGNLGVLLKEDQQYTNISLDISRLNSLLSDYTKSIDFVSKFGDNALAQFERAALESKRPILNAVTVFQLYNTIDDTLTYQLVYFKDGRPYFFQIFIDSKNNADFNKARQNNNALSYREILIDIFSKQSIDIQGIQNVPITEITSGDAVNIKVRQALGSVLSTGFTVSYNYPFQFQEVKTIVNQATGQTSTAVENKDSSLNIQITFSDSSLFKSIDAVDANLNLRNPVEYKINLDSQNKQEAAKKEQERQDQKALLDQVQQSLSFQSSLELTLRTIQVKALNKAINQIPDKPDKNIGNKVFVLEIAKDKPFLISIFSNGLFNSFITDLISNQSQQSTDDQLLKATSDERFKIYSKYGFLSSLLGNKASLSQINSLKGNVDYEKLLTAFVVPYRIEQELVAGIKTNHPVYIPFGFLLMLMNHTCTIYDSRRGSNTQTPLVYIDYNPELNFFLTNNQQLSTDPFKVLIPFEGNNLDYQELFYDEVLIENKTGIAAYKDSSQSIPLFKPESQDLISYKIQEYTPVKLGKVNDDSNTSAFRGRAMNILLSIDYLTDLVRQYSLKDGSNNVYLRPFLEEILTTINKSLGNFNSFRLSYNDSSNTFQIVDDQVIPTLGEELMVPPKSNPLDITNRTEIPLIGKTSIAKSLETRTDISSKLGSLIAISANPKMTDKSTLSTSADAVGFINTAFSDRYVTNRLAVSSNTTSSLRESRIAEAIMFNSTITDFYSSANPSDSDVSQVTSYYIERMSKVKNSHTGSLAAAMVPIGINFTTDGISGMNMGQAFTVSDELLPYSYTAQFRPGYIDNYNKYVGFVIVGMNHTIEANQWNTSVRTNMIALKDKTAFKANPVKALPPKDDKTFTEASEVTNPNSRANVNSLSSQLNIAIPFFKNNLKFNDIATAAAIGNLIQESGLNYKAWNIGATVGQNTTINAGSSKGDTLTDPVNLTFTGRGFTNRGVTAYGIAQWTQSRKEAYIQFRDKNGGDSLQTQLKFLQSELNSSYKNSVLEPMKLQNDIVSATSVWLRNYEGINADLQQRVSYANGVLDYIKSRGL